MSDDKGLSIKAVVGLLVAVVLMISWSFLAAEYAKEVQAWEPAGQGLIRGRASFLWASIVAMCSMFYNGLQQIPNVIEVTRFSLLDRFWAVVATLVVIGLLIAGGIGVARLERSLDAPKKTLRRKS